MTLPQTAYAALLAIGFLGLITATAAMVPCLDEGFSIASVVRVYGCR